MTSVTSLSRRELAASDPLDWLQPDRTASQYPNGGTEAQHYALFLDKALWRGFDELVLPWLHALCQRGPLAERAAAGWVLARWYVDQGDTIAAHEAISQYHNQQEDRGAIPHAGPYLLGVQLMLARKDTLGARNILSRAIERFGHGPDMSLARLLIARAENEPDAEISALLGQIYDSSDIAPVCLAPKSGSLFDRLHAETQPSQTSADHSGAASEPLVSVIVPVFNGRSVLPKALSGLQAQTWPNLEILIVDDGSSDDTLRLAQDAAKLDPRVRVIALSNNQGAYVARNEGLAEARGSFITVHDADDWSHPEKIERQARALIADPSLKASVSHWVRAGDALEMTRWRTEDSWIFRNVSSLMLRAEQRDELGYWDRVTVSADTEYYYRILAAYGPAAIKEVCPGVPLAFGRTLPGSLTSRSATHARTEHAGVRHDYLESAHIWHGKAKQPNDLYMPRLPASRPFCVPDLIAIDKGSQIPSAFDKLTECTLMDEEWYLLANPDVMQSSLGGAMHFLLVGGQEGRDPGPLFSAGGYRQSQGLPNEENPLLHYLNTPASLRSPALPSFKGTLSDTNLGAPCALIFAHTSGENLFGAERSLIDVIKRLARKGFTPVVVLPTIRNTAYLERVREISGQVETLPQIWRHGLVEQSIETIEAARALIRKYRPSEVHVNTVVLEAPLLAARAEGVPSVLYVREMPHEDKALCRSIGMSAISLRRQLLDQADHFVMASQVVADWLDCPERCTVRPNAIDEDLFDLPFEPGPVLRVALISSNILKKGIRDAVEVARIVASSGWPVHFLLIGPETSDLERLHPLPPNVMLRGYAPTPVEAVEQADIILSLSHFAESFGRTVVEAMAAGRPVICYDRGAPPSLIISGQTGFVVPSDSPIDVADGVLALNAARLQLSNMSRAARRRAREIQDQALS